MRISLRPRLAQRNFEAEIAHHGSDDGVVTKRARLRHATTHHRHHVVAVEDFALLVDEHRAIRIAIEGDPDVAFFPQHGLANLVSR